MPQIRSVFFWLNGVVTPPLWRLTRDALAPGGAAGGPQLDFALIDLDRDLARGAAGADEYCARAVELASAALSPGALADAIEKRLAATPGVASILDELASSYQLWLLADYPRRWLLPALRQPELAGRFPDERIVMTGQYRAGDASGALLEAIVASPAFAADESLLVDADWLRAMAAARAGLCTNIFVDARRLRRDLGIWKMLPPR